MKKAHIALSAAPAVLILTTTLLSYGRGALPGTNGTLGRVPADAPRRAPACGFCHGPANGNGLKVFVDVAKQALSAGEQTTVTVRSTGGVQKPPPNKDWGGFLAEFTSGKVSGSNLVQTDASGRFATHTFAFNGLRNWKLGYTAGNTPGLVEVFAVVNTVDGNGRNTGDTWAFFGGDANTNRPVRMYVNAKGVQQTGAGCEGGFGNSPVLGSKTVPTVGNGNFEFEVHGARPRSPLAVLLGAQPGVNLDLSAIGMTGCRAYVNVLFSLNGLTSAGNLQNGEGTATIKLPIPNNPIFRGGKLQAQAAIVDPSAPRPLKIVMTNGVELTIQ